MYGYDKDEPHLGGFILGGDPNSYATEVWDYLILKGVKSVVDVGCGQGHTVKYFNDKGIECTGIEGCKEAISSSVIKDRIIQHDFTKGKVKLSKKFDAAWSCEFVEHVEEKYIDNFLSVFDKCKCVLMTHGLPGQVGYHHVNCQSSDYWITKMLDRGFIFDVDESQKIRKMTDRMHVKNSLLFFYKQVEK